VFNPKKQTEMEHAKTSFFSNFDSGNIGNATFEEQKSISLSAIKLKDPDHSH
jgi:hypothetical protein